MNKALENTQLENKVVNDQSDLQKNGWAQKLSSVMHNSRFIQMLCVLLALQLLVAGALALKANRAGDFTAGDPLLAIAADNIDKIEISDGDEQVVLNRQGDDWTIKGDATLPVEASRIEALMDTLGAMKTVLPVASSVNAREQLEVADDRFKRRVTLSGGDSDPVTLLVGSSPGIRKAHVRRDGSDDIFSTTLPVSDLPSSVNQWLDKSLLSVAGVNSIRSADVSFKLAGEGDNANWVVAEPDGDNRQIDKEKIATAVQALQNLQVAGVVLKPSDEQAETGTSTISVSGESREVSMTLQSDEQSYSVTRDDVAGVFTITQAVYEQLLPLGNPESLLMDSDNSSPAEPSAAQQATTDGAQSDTAKPESTEIKKSESEAVAE